MNPGREVLVDFVGHTEVQARLDFIVRIVSRIAQEFQWRATRVHSDAVGVISVSFETRPAPEHPQRTSKAQLGNWLIGKVQLGDVGAPMIEIMAESVRLRRDGLAFDSLD